MFRSLELSSLAQLKYASFALKTTSQTTHLTALKAEITHRA